MGDRRAGAADTVVRLLHGGQRPSAYELAAPGVLDVLSFVLRTLAVRAARNTGTTPEELVEHLVEEATAAVGHKPGVPIDARTRALHRIRSMARDGKSSYTIAAALNADDMPSPHGRRWHRRAVEALLPEAYALDDDDDDGEAEPAEPPPSLHIAH